MSSNPDKTSTSRKLAAIMFSDIVGYTALMGKDEDRAFQVLRKNRELHKTALENHNGRMLKELGDGILASFEAVSDAVYCALEIQQQASADPDFSLKVGIHLGEVVFEGGDVHGDGVNIASRLSDVAKDGHVLISEAVYKNVANKKGINTQFIDKMTLKNVAEPVDIYMINMGSAIEDPGSSNEIRGSFWSEVKRRNITRSLISYLLLGILIRLIADMAFPIWNFPSWAFPVLEVMLIAGLPLAMILAWKYERSPEGLVRTSSQKSWQNPYTTEQRKPLTSNSIIGSLLLITIFVYTYPRIITEENFSENIDNSVKRFNINFPENAPVALVGRAPSQWSYSSLDVSPDGKILAYVAEKDETTLLYIRNMDKLDVIPIKGTEGAYGPVFSPDNKWVAFGQSQKLMKIAVPDGTPVQMAETGDFRDAVWLNNDEIIYTTNNNFFKISSRSNEPQILSSRDSTGSILLSYASGIDLTPDNKHLLYSDFRTNIYSLNLSTLKHNLVYANGGGSPKYIESGHLAFSRSNNLFAVPFDYKSMSTLGIENQVLNGIRTERSGQQLCYSQDGMAIYIEGSYYQRALFTWIDDEGNTTPLNIPPNSYGSFDISPDGNYLAVSMLPAKEHINVFDLKTGRITPIRVDGAEIAYSPVWGSDSRSIMFSSSVSGKWTLYNAIINSIDEPRPILVEEVTGSVNYPYSWSENGEFLTIEDRIVRLNNMDNPEIFISVPESHHAEISPSGKFLVYASNESGEQEIYLQPFPATGEKWQLSIGGGTDPIWSPEGKAIYYHDNQKILKIEFDETKLTFSTPKIFYTGAFINAVSRSLVTSLDGKSVLILQPVSGTQLAHEAVAAINWFEEVKRLAPAGE
jgi:class 3 adenylate cyclase/Tol biopolymer transport system component